MPRDTAAVQSIAADFNFEINAAYGLYLDCISGFSELAQRINKFQVETGATDESPFLYRFGGPGHPDDALIHKTTPGILKQRIQAGGGHYFHIGRFLVVMLFELWESAYRRRLAKAAGVRGALREPIFGDLRLLRHAILHNRGRLKSKEAAKLELLTPAPSGLVDYNDAEIKQVIRLVKTALDGLVKQWTGDDPGYRKPFVTGNEGPGRRSVRRQVRSRRQKRDSVRREDSLRRRRE